MQELIRNTSINVGTSAVVVSEEQFPPNSQRSVIFLVNTSTGGQTITITPQDEAVAGKGVPVKAGGFYQDSRDSGYLPTNARITAISDLAGGTLSIHERVLMGGF